MHAAWNTAPSTAIANFPRPRPVIERALEFGFDHARAFYSERERAPERWWITTERLTHGGEKVLGPFESKDLALDVRYWRELANGDGGPTYWIEQEPTDPVPSTTEGGPTDEDVNELIDMPRDLLAVLRDPSIIIRQDAAVFELIAKWQNAPAPTMSGPTTTEGVGGERETQCKVCFHAVRLHGPSGCHSEFCTCSRSPSNEPAPETEDEEQDRVEAEAQSDENWRAR